MIANLKPDRAMKDWGVEWSREARVTPKLSYYAQIVSALRRQLAAEHRRSFVGNNLRVILQFAAVFHLKQIVVSLSRQLRSTHFLAWIPLEARLQHDDEETYLATDQRNVLDWNATQQRLSLAMEFVTAVAKQPAITGARI